MKLDGHQALANGHHSPTSQHVWHLQSWGKNTQPSALRRVSQELFQDKPNQETELPLPPTPGQVCMRAFRAKAILIPHVPPGPKFHSIVHFVFN